MSFDYQRMIVGMFLALSASFGFAQIRSTPTDTSAFPFTSPVDFAPWYTLGKNNQVDGIMYRVALEIANELQRPLKFNALPFARLAKEGQELQFDVTMTESDAFASIASTVGPVVTMNKYGLVSLAKNKRFEDCSQIKTVVHTIGGNESILARIQEQCGPKTIIRVSSFKQRFTMVSSGRADACVSSDRELEIVPGLGWIRDIFNCCHCFQSRYMFWSGRPQPFIRSHFVHSFQKRSREFWSATALVRQDVTLCRWVPNRMQCRLKRQKLSSQGKDISIFAPSALS